MEHLSAGLKCCSKVSFYTLYITHAHLNERIFVHQECQNQWVSPSSQKLCHKSAASTLILGGKFYFPYLIVTD